MFSKRNCTNCIMILFANSGIRFYMIFLLLSTSLGVLAQQKLAATVNMPAYPKTTVGEVFKVLKEQQDVLFSFNGNILQLDSILYPQAYRGTLYGYLDGLLGKEYSFKELGRHIIVQYTPQRMSVDVEVHTPAKNRAVITGYVKNIRTNNPVANASIFDRSALLSTLSDDNGYFELDVKKKSSLIAVNVSKETFRDTSVMVIFPIEARVGHKKKREYGYFEGYEEDHGLYRSFFGRVFLSPAQRIQSMNLGGLFLYSPYQISMTPGLSSHGFIRSQIVNKFSLNIIGGATAGVSGVELGGVFNINQYDMRGVQVGGVFNAVGGNVGGAQLAGIANRVFASVNGVQVAGVINKADTVRGVQLAGIANTAKEAKGTVQIAGLLNNSAADVGIQVAGIVNKAKGVKGFQLAGIVNIADSNDYPIGLLNLIKNGERNLSLAIDEESYLGLQFRSGGRVLYSILSVQAALADDGQSKYAFEAGLGAVLLRRKKFSVRGEIVSRNHLTDKFKMLDNHRSSFRIIPAYQLSNSLSLFLAPSFNYAEKDEDAPSAAGTQWKAWRRDRTRNTFYGGGMAGLMLKL